MKNPRRKRSDEEGESLQTSFKTGVIALVFLVLGYQAALFVHKAAVTRIAADRDRPDTVFVIDRTLAAQLLDSTPREQIPREGPVVVRRNAPHAPAAERVREWAPRPVENFRFNPNTATLEDFCRLGFSQRQAQSILNYRQKGGRFFRKEDFAKSFVVADSVYRRLELYITIPKLDINAADSAAFDALPGIGGYFAARMVAHREELGGYSSTEQLMDIYRFDQEKYDALKDLVYVGGAGPKALRLWQMPADSLRQHPYIRSAQTARAIVLYRENNPRTEWTVEGLRRSGVITDDQASRLGRCLVAEP